MAEDPDLTDAIEAAAAEPAVVTVDGASVTARSLRELIEADRYLKEQQALAAEGATGRRSGWGATRPARVVPPGSLGERNREA